MKYNETILASLRPIPSNFYSTKEGVISRNYSNLEQLLNTV